MEGKAVVQIRAALEALRLSDYVPDAYRQLMIGNCLVRLGLNQAARASYIEALEGYLTHRLMWASGGMINLLVESYLLAGRSDLFAKTAAEADAYRADKRALAPVAQYAFALVELIRGNLDQTQKHVAQLIAKPRFKLTFEAGAAIQELVDRHDEAVPAAIERLLQVHANSAKHGALRDTHERYICLPAMAISILATNIGININSKSEYYSESYLQLLRAGSGLA